MADRGADGEANARDKVPCACAACACAPSEGSGAGGRCCRLEVAAHEARMVCRNVLLVLGALEDVCDEAVRRDFYGEVLEAGRDGEGLRNPPDWGGKTVYVCGNVYAARVGALRDALERADRVLEVRGVCAEQCEGANESAGGGQCAAGAGREGQRAWERIAPGRVPIAVHGVGVLYRRFFVPEEVAGRGACDGARGGGQGVEDDEGEGRDSEHSGFFERIHAEHEFQALTESNKPGRAHRTGIYLTPVRPDELGDLHFRLLRCSTNLSGPTDNFRATDHRIVDALNREAAGMFDGAAPLNHALAQTYWNRAATASTKMAKARIASHADKTKDMAANGVMAFCTFYAGLREHLEPSPSEPFDWVYKRKTSGLTLLRFRLKKVVAQRPGCALTPQFDVTLYPDSVFFMPLSTNRWYTHEICPALLSAQQLPTRLGYVVRCSATEAVFRDHQTYIKVPSNDAAPSSGNGPQGNGHGAARDDVTPEIGAAGNADAQQDSGTESERGEGRDACKLVPLMPSTAEGVAELRRLYAEENFSDSVIDYGHRFLFSMNDGDYLQPLYRPSDEFRQYAVPMPADAFAQLLAPVRFEGVCKGRQGTVLVLPHSTRGAPIVRTTTKYAAPAQRFAGVHAELAERIERCASLPCALNNALVEVYTNHYTKMGAHSDQALDLAPGSHIAVYSCYENAASTSRKLVVEAKSGGESFEVPLLHNSVVVWSLDTNRRFRHKIVLDLSDGQPPNNRWLGFTFRTSSTFVRCRRAASEGAHDGADNAVFEDGTPLSLATEEQRKEFYSMRRRENNEVDFRYPHLKYTISPSDTMPCVR